MTSYGSAGQGNGHGRDGERAPGARRQKVFGYIKAANELRQSYQSQLSSRLQSDGESSGDFPDIDIVRSGDEEMLLFPSYARPHIKKHWSQSGSSDRSGPASQDHMDVPQSSGDAEYWRREWEVFEDANAQVDVDVRGWIYSPQKEPYSRRNRLLVAVARRLSGIPAPENMPDGRDSGARGRTQDHMMSHEEEAAAREADIIAQRGQKEAEAAWRGSYSLTSNGSPVPSRSSSPTGSYRRSAGSGAEDDSTQSQLSKRMSWNIQAEMSREEQLRANRELMKRLRPFMTLPLANTPITVFFFNDRKSQSKTVTTDESGHFNLRAALDFIPTKVRVLASETLSAVEDVIITEAKGISLISDVDDTIKHSAIASGAKEIFKNTFIRELSDLTIQGVKEWYTKVASMGVQMHYVSNSPWQLYPLLQSYFLMAGLPHGSFHLKQYSGMLQGIFEPAAERKKGSLERIMRDFPERKFILVGDSGEADLEVYTDVVLANPGRVLGVFIRDVTTPEKKHFFDQAMHNGKPDSDRSRRPAEYLARSRSDMPESRPSLPTRSYSTAAQKPQEENLIDFDDEPERPSPQKSNDSYMNDLQQLHLEDTHSPRPPNRPVKPSNLRSVTTTAQQPTSRERPARSSTYDPENKRPPPPPKPRRSSQTIDTSSIQNKNTQRPPFSSSRQNSHQVDRPVMPDRTPSTMTQSSTYSTRDEEGYVASARRHLTSAYNALPAIRSQSPTRDERSSSPTRRGIASYPAAAARWATGATGGDPAAGGDGGAPGAPYNKKEEIWKRRWIRSEEIMKRNGVLLRTWRIGEDVMDDCIKLIEREQKSSQ